VVTEWSQNFRKLANQWHQPAPPDDTAKACDLRKCDNGRYASTRENTRFWEFKSHLHRQPPLLGRNVGLLTPSPGLRTSVRRSWLPISSNSLIRLLSSERGTHRYRRSGGNAMSHATVVRAGRSRFGALAVVAALIASVGLTVGSTAPSLALAPTLSALAITPTAFDFGDVPVGSNSATQLVTVTNVSSASMVLSQTPLE